MNEETWQTSLKKMWSRRRYIRIQDAMWFLFPVLIAPNVYYALHGYESNLVAGVVITAIWAVSTGLLARTLMYREETERIYSEIYRKYGSTSIRKYGSTS